MRSCRNTFKTRGSSEIVLRCKIMPMAIERVLFYNVKKCRKMIDMGCVAPDEMPSSN